MKIHDFKIRLEDARTINEFMGKMAYSCSSAELIRFWNIMDKYNKMYSEHFVAEMIRKDSKAVTLELYKDITGARREILCHA